MYYKRNFFLLATLYLISKFCFGANIEIILDQLPNCYQVTDVFLSSTSTDGNAHNNSTVQSECSDISSCPSKTNYVAYISGVISVRRDGSFAGTNNLLNNSGIAFVCYSTLKEKSIGLIRNNSALISSAWSHNEEFGDCNDHTSTSILQTGSSANIILSNLNFTYSSTSCNTNLKHICGCIYKRA